MQEPAAGGGRSRRRAGKVGEWVRRRAVGQGVSGRAGGWRSGVPRGGRQRLGGPRLRGRMRMGRGRDHIMDEPNAHESGEALDQRVSIHTAHGARSHRSLPHPCRG